MQSKKVVMLFTAAMLCFAAMGAPSDGLAAAASTPTADPVCDPNVLNLMRQKGWMEAQRENYTNQSLILKPDSAFDLTCFDKQLGIAKSELGVNEKTSTTNDTSRYQETIDNTAGTIAGTFAGGTLTPSKNNTTSPPATSDPSDSFPCNEMDNVWKNTMCGNMSGGDMPTLQEAGGTGDSRSYPANAACSTSTGGKNDNATGGTANNYNTILEQQYTQANAGIAGVPALNTYDCQHIPYSQLGVAPNNCPQTCTTISLSGRGTDRDGNVLEVSCPNPGCHPEPSGSGSGYTCRPD